LTPILKRAKQPADSTNAEPWHTSGRAPWLRSRLRECGEPLRWYPVLPTSEAGQNKWDRDTAAKASLKREVDQFGHSSNSGSRHATNSGTQSCKTPAGNRFPEQLRVSKGIADSVSANWRQPEAVKKSVSVSLRECPPWGTPGGSSSRIHDHPLLKMKAESLLLKTGY
jgi:hypothetical protein